MKKFNFDNFNIKKIESIIGHYDDLKDKNQNIFYNENTDEQVKKFKRYSVTLVLEPKHQICIIANKPNYDIGKLEKKMKGEFDIVPFIKNDELYYKIVDHSKLIVKDFFITLNDYYDYKTGAELVRKRIKNSGNAPNIEYNDTQSFLNQFIINRVFNYKEFVL